MSRNADHRRHRKSCWITGCSPSPRWTPESRWIFVHVNGRGKETLNFQPHLSMNDYAGLAAALVVGAGIGELPPVVQPQLVRDGRLIEIMPK